MLTKIQKYLTIDGKVTLENEDISLSGVLPFCWERRYFSDMGKTALGFGWLHSYYFALKENKELHFVSVLLSQGETIYFQPLAIDEIAYHRPSQHFLKRDSQGYLLTDAQGLCYRFQGNKNREGYQMLSEVATSED